MIDLAHPHGEDIKRFVVLVTTLALQDHHQGIRKRRTGIELCKLFCREWRNGHERMATGIYNQTRWTLEVARRDPR